MNTGEVFKGFTEEEKRAIRVIVSDVDDTITMNGRLIPRALSALWAMRLSGYSIFLVTGGSAGWADSYVRQWPVDAVICESGAVMVAPYYGKNAINYTPGTEDGRDYEIPFNDYEGIGYSKNPLISPNALEKKAVFDTFTQGFKQSEDCYARIYDTAFIRSKLTEEDEEVIREKAERMGGKVWKSSIHINVGFGDYSKSQALFFFLPLVLDIKKEDIPKKCLYIGDSLNDEEMFESIPISVGMHSVEDLRSEFKYLPRYITEEYGGVGFYKVAKSLVGFL